MHHYLFEFESKKVINTHPCYIARTNQDTIDVIKNNPSDKWNIIIITLHEIVCEEFTQDKILEFLEIEKELSTQD